MSDSAPLAGLVVVELDAIGPVPFAGRQLALLGASVTRVVPPSRRVLDVGLDAETDLLARGKARRAIDLKTATGAEKLHALLGRADVLLEGFRPGVLERLGLAPAALAERHPALVVGRLSGYGSRGPLAGRAGHDINYLALSGALWTIGAPERPAVPLNLVADFGGGGMHLALGVLAALVRRGIDGCGSVVETSILAGTLGLTPMLHALLAADAWTLAREANLLDGGRPFYRLYRTADDRFVAVGALEPRFFEALLALTDLEKEIDAARQYEAASWPAMTVAFERVFRRRPRDAWAVDAERLDCCVSPVLDPHEALAHAQCRENGLVADAPFPHPGSVLDVGRP